MVISKQFANLKTNNKRQRQQFFRQLEKGYGTQFNVIEFDITFFSTNALVMKRGAMLPACYAKQNTVPIRHTQQWNVRLKPQTKSETVMKQRIVPEPSAPVSSQLHHIKVW